MDAFSTEDIFKYYRHSYIRNPKNPDQILQVHNVDTTTKEVSLLTLKQDSTITVKQSDILWDHVKIPRLGYRCLEGKQLYYITKIVQRNITKGLNSSTVNIETDTRLGTLLSKIDYASFSKYVGGNSLRRDGLVQELFHPAFVSLPQACNNLLQAVKTGRIAEAINHDFALVLGKSSDKILTLLFKGFIQAAHSKDGARWSLVNDEYRESIARGIGELNYV